MCATKVTHLLPLLGKTLKQTQDIKPENILIDASGSVVLTDFGISRRFPKNTLHITNDKWEWTRKYASPEIMKGKKVPRDDPSDVFSLGCVFLEMATLILGRDLETFRDFYAKSVNESIEDAYHCNLDNVYQWIENLKTPQHAEPRSVPSLSNEHIEDQDFMPDPNSKMIEGLKTIQLMLEPEPGDRPPAKGLWEKFKHVSSQICRDCDPRHEGVWKPTPTQKNAADSGAHRRRSMQLIPEEASDNPSMESREPQEKTDESLLSANYKPDRNSKLRRASSPHAGRNHSLRPTYASVLQNPFPTSKPTAVVSDPGPTDQLNVAGASASTVPLDQQTASTASTLPSARRTTQETATTYSRSSSPKRRRPYSHSGSFNASPPSPPPALPTPPVKFTNPSSPPPVPSALVPTKPHKPPSPPPASGGDSTPAAFHPLSPTPSLSVRRQSVMAVTTEHQEKPIPNGIPTVPRQDSLPPSSQIIIYDLKDQIAYVAAYAQIKGKRPGVDYLAQQLPGSGRHIAIGEKGAPIATVDLGGLGFWTSCRRRLGHFPTLYVLNFSSQPNG
ncbi:MAG: hypothetical protein LQ351_003146 [Letrouitia transgressa]|nr:MAG: hypothetical protein LQ351_003146 [Letrouitia transgressa]